MFHTQENRNTSLIGPRPCDKPGAWLGYGYYFWEDVKDAHKWGVDYKNATGSYQIYKADITSENILDTVFNENHYKFWLEAIEMVASDFERKRGVKPSIKDINEYFKRQSTWGDIDGILFQDLPKSPSNTPVRDLFYRKRIQFVAYKIKIAGNFALNFESER